MATRERDLEAVLAEWHTETVADVVEPGPESAEQIGALTGAAFTAVLADLENSRLLSRHIAAAAQEISERFEASVSKVRAANMHAALWVGAGTEPIDVEFARLVDEWKEDIEFEPSLTRVVMHRAYQRIIGMGSAVVPLILEELEREPDHWFWALTAITGEHPAEDAETLDEATDRWLEWGRARGLVA